MHAYQAFRRFTANPNLLAMLECAEALEKSSRCNLCCLSMSITWKFVLGPLLTALLQLR
jgi:hypothetical protein